MKQRTIELSGFVTDPDGSPAANYDISLYDSFTDRARARKAVRHERRIELGMEDHRFFDLKRWGQLSEVLNNYLSAESSKRTYLIGAVFDEDVDTRMPIPQLAIDQSEGTLIRNSGY